MGTRQLGAPEYQLGAGCLVDQLVGQFMAHVCGLGYLVDPSHVSSTLTSILKYNRRQGFEGHFNCMRSYVLGDESALLMASYPRERPANPFPYFTEVMTGFEYTAAVGMLYEGMTAEGLACIGDIRDRYDGRKRSPFDEAECGHHYARDGKLGRGPGTDRLPLLCCHADADLRRAAGPALLVERRSLGHMPDRTGRRHPQRHTDRASWHTAAAPVGAIRVGRG